MIRLLPVLFLWILAGFGVSPAVAAELAVLARPGPWPVADNLVVYQNKIWFSAAVKGVNHNSADIWSYEPTHKNLQFERYLFTQDTGYPTVHKGYLYWPHEDMRIGLGNGMVTVTDGRTWQTRTIASQDHMMHTHAVAEWRGQLVAALAGWNSSLAVSSDGGKDWQLLVNDKPRVGRFHRYNHLAVLGEHLYVRHWETTGMSLAEYRDGEIKDVVSWPKNRTFSKLVRFKDALYSLVRNDDGENQLWRLKDGVARPLEVKTGGAGKVLLVSDQQALWIITADRNQGRLWVSDDGLTFVAQHSFHGGWPYSAVVLQPGKVYVGGEGADGRAVLWGPSASPSQVALTAAPPPLMSDPYRNRNFDIDGARQRMALALGDPASYARRGRPLQGVINDLLRQGPADGFFASFLEQSVPEQSVPTFGGRFQVPLREIANWQLLSAMAQNAEPRIPLRFLQKPWLRKSNGPQKWSDELLIALHTVQRVKQNDQKTIDLLINRLADPGDPDWLQSQISGTLVGLTGRHFAYDTDAWKKWWALARADWPTGVVGG